MAKDYSNVELSHLYYVDNAAMQLARATKQFDTIVTDTPFASSPQTL